jgi:hypothetical protein
LPESQLFVFEIIVAKILSFANNRSGQKLLGNNTFIPVMEAAELWNGDYLSNIQHLSRKWRLLV